MTDIQTQIRDYAEYVERLTPEHQPAPAGRRRLRSSTALAAASLVVIAVGLAAIIAPLTAEDPVADQLVATTLPDAVVAPEETAPPTTAAETADDIVAPSINWTRIEGEPFAGREGRIHSVSPSDSGYVAGGAQGRDASVWVSPDGETWEKADDPAGVFTGAVGQHGDSAFREIRGFASKDGRTIAAGFEAVGDRPGGSRPFNQIDWMQLDSSAAVWFTDDGTVWQRVEHDPEVFGSDGPNRMLSVAATDDWFLAVGDGAWRSSDGVAWERLASPPARLWDVIAEGNAFMAAGPDPADAQTPGIWSSLDGTVWTKAVVDTPRLDSGVAHRARAYALTATDTGFLAAGVLGNDGSLDGIVWRSSDGSHWEVAERAPLGKWEWMAGIAAEGTRAVAVGTQEWNGAVGLIWESTDTGLTWTWSKPPAFGEFGKRWAVVFDLIIDNGRLIAAGIEEDQPVVWVGEWSDR